MNEYHYIFGHVVERDDTVTIKSIARIRHLIAADATSADLIAEDLAYEYAFEDGRVLPYGYVNMTTQYPVMFDLVKDGVQ